MKNLKPFRLSKNHTGTNVFSHAAENNQINQINISNNNIENQNNLRIRLISNNQNAENINAQGSNNNISNDLDYE